MTKMTKYRTQTLGGSTWFGGNHSVEAVETHNYVTQCAVKVCSV